MHTYFWMQSNKAPGQLHRTLASSRPCLFRRESAKSTASSLSFRKDTALVSCPASALQLCQPLTFWPPKKYKPDAQLQKNVLLGASQVEFGVPANIPAYTLPDFVFSSVSANEVRDLPAWRTGSQVKLPIGSLLSLLDYRFHSDNVSLRFSLFKLIHHC